MAKAIPSLAPAVEGTALGQAAYANAARNSLKDLFRGPVAPLLQGVRQPTLAESIGKYGLDSTKIIDAAAKTNAVANAAGAAGLGIGILDAAAGADTGCGCEK